MKTFSNRSNAARDARKALGQHAAPDVDFHLVPHEGGRYGWVAGKQPDSTTSDPVDKTAKAAASLPPPVKSTPEEIAARREERRQRIAREKAEGRRDASGTKTKADGEAKAPRETKADKALAMMRREGGVTGPELQAELGWQAHTVRGFISGHVRKKLGLEVATETVRSVGPNETGAKGSFTRYHIAAGPEG